MENSSFNPSNIYTDGAAPSAFTLTKLARSIHVHNILPSEVEYNKRTRVKTVNLSEEGIIIFEPKGTQGELHQISVPSAGCSTALIVLDGERVMWQFPVLQTGSFKLGAAFFDGLTLHISSSVDAPPRLTVNWRAI